MGNAKCKIFMKKTINSSYWFAVNLTLSVAQAVDFGPCIPNFRLFQHSPIDVATIQNFTRIRESLLSHMRKQVFHNGTVGKEKTEVLL